MFEPKLGWMGCISPFPLYSFARNSKLTNVASWSYCPIVLFWFLALSYEVCSLFRIVVRPFLCLHDWLNTFVPLLPFLCLPEQLNTVPMFPFLCPGLGGVSWFKKSGLRHPARADKRRSGPGGQCRGPGQRPEQFYLFFLNWCWRSIWLSEPAMYCCIVRLLFEGRV